MFELFTRLVTIRVVLSFYGDLGYEIADCMSYPGGQIKGFDSRLRWLVRWEKEVARRGFRTLTWDDFFHLGPNTDCASLLQVRAGGEEAIFHAQAYLDSYAAGPRSADGYGP